MANGTAIGSGIGAAAGSFIPGIGTVLGSTLGGAIGGLFGGGSGPTPEEKRASALREQAAKAATDDYASRGMFRGLAQGMLGNNTAPDLSRVYAGGPQNESVDSPLLRQANGAQGTLLSSLTNGPDYVQQSREALADFDANEKNVLADQYRTIGQRSAAGGRIGSKMADEENSRALADSSVKRKTLSNDLIRAAVDQAQRDKYSNLTAAQSVGDRAYAQGSNERANRQGVAQQGVSNRAAQFGAEQGAQGQRFGQGATLAGIGYGNNPSGVLLNAAGGAQNAGQFTAGQNDENANDVASLFGVAGQMLGKRGKSSGMTLKDLGFDQAA